MNFLFVSAFSPRGRESGANRLRKLRVGLEAGGASVQWLVPGERGDRVGVGTKIFAVFSLLCRAVTWGIRNDGWILVSLPPPWIVAVAAPLSVLFGARVILDFRDPLLNQSINPRGKLFALALSLLERVSVWRAGRVILAAPRIVDYLPSSAKAKSLPVLAGVDPAEVVPASVTRTRRVVYGGTFYGSRSPWPLLNALRRYSGSLTFDFRVDLPIEESAKVAAFLSEHGLEGKVRFSGLTSRKEFLDLLSASEIALVITHSSGSGYAIPGKVFDYVSTGSFLWVITEDAALLELLAEYEIPSLVTGAWSEQAILQALTRLDLEAKANDRQGAAAERLSCVRQAERLSAWLAAPLK